MNAVLGNLWLTAPLLQKVMPKLNPQAGAMLGTVCSFSKIEGNDKRCTAAVSFKAVDEGDMARDLDALASARWSRITRPSPSSCPPGRTPGGLPTSVPVCCASPPSGSPHSSWAPSTRTMKTLTWTPSPAR